MSFFLTRRYRRRHDVLTLVDPLTGREWHVRRGSGWPTRAGREWHVRAGREWHVRVV